jgi:hypothetical protein
MPPPPFISLFDIAMVFSRHTIFHFQVSFSPFQIFFSLSAFRRRRFHGY